MGIFEDAAQGQLRGLEFVQQGIERGEAKARTNSLASLAGQYASGQYAPEYAQGAQPLPAHKDRSRLMALLLGGDSLRAYDEARARKQRGTLSELAASYASGTQEPNARFYEDVARNGGDPMAFRNDAQSQRERALKEAGQIAGLVASAGSPEARAAMYQSVLPRLAPISQQLGVPLAPAWDEAHLPEVQQIYAMYGGGGADPFKPMNVSPGGEVVDPRTGRVIHANQNFAPQKPIWDSQRGGFAMPPGQDGPQGAPTGAVGGFVPTVAPRPDYEAQRLALAQQAAARADQAAADAAAARHRAQWGAAPAGQRFNDQGVLVPIPGYAPPKGANGDEAKGAAGAAGLVTDAVAYAASDTGVDPQVVSQMTPEQVRDLVKGKRVEVGGKAYTRQTRWMTGPITGRIPGAGIFANSDLEAYRSSAAGKQARVNNPTGPVTNADFEVGAKSVWGPDKPDEVNGDLIYNALKRGSQLSASARPAAPQPSVRATEGQVVENAQGVRLQLRGGQWVRIN